MPKKKYIVALSSEERQTLERLIGASSAPIYVLNHAQILLKSDVNQAEGGQRDQDISEALKISVSTVERVRQRFVEQSLEVALSRQIPVRTKPRLLDQEQEAQLLAIARAETPKGQGRWTLRLLADRMVELGYVESISHETVRQTLKKELKSP